MNSQTALFELAVVLFFLILLVTGVVFLRRARSLRRTHHIDELLSRLVQVDRHKLRQVAADLSTPEAHAELEPWQVWDLVGGLEGIQALARNCDVLIDLACYVQQWYPEALPVAEQLRLSAREIQWHLDRLQGAQRRGNLETAFPDYAQRAAAIYYGMTLHVLALFEISKVPGLAELQASL